MADDKLDDNTKKVRKFSIWAGAFLLFLAVAGVVTQGVASAAKKAVFYYKMPEQLKEIRLTTATILKIVCEYHKSDKCPRGNK